MTQIPPFSPDPVQQVSSPPALPDRPVGGHKGLFGRVLIVGGSEGMIGAPAMSGRAALKLGSGLVELAVPRSILAAALMITPELIGIPLPDEGGVEMIDGPATAADVVAIGPGLGKSPASWGRLQRLFRGDHQLVIDADALNLLAEQPRWPEDFRARAVLTPHPGEMKRLAKLLGKDTVPTDDSGRLALAVEASGAFGQVIVLKGDRTVVTDGQRYFLNDTGNSALSKAGTGDVLTGMVASLIGQKMSLFDAACAAVYLHGRAGEIAGEKLGLRCVLAHDVIDALPQAVREYEHEFI